MRKSTPKVPGKETVWARLSPIYITELDKAVLEIGDGSRSNLIRFILIEWIKTRMNKNNVK